MKINHRWTPEEDAFLMANRGTMDYATMGKHLGRTEKGVSLRARYIGAHIPKAHQWTPEEDEMLKAQSKDLSVRQIAEAIGVSQNAVTHRLRTLRSMERRRQLSDAFTQTRTHIRPTDPDMSTGSDTLDLSKNPFHMIGE